MLNEKERVVIYNNLKNVREDGDFTQIKLAEIVGINETHYQKIEYGKTIPNVHTAIHIAETLGINEFNKFKDLFGIPQRQLREISPLKNY